MVMFNPKANFYTLSCELFPFFLDLWYECIVIVFSFIYSLVTQ